MKVAEVCRKMGISEATGRHNLALIQLEEEVRRPRHLRTAPAAGAGSRKPAAQEARRRSLIGQAHADAQKCLRVRSSKKSYEASPAARACSVPRRSLPRA